MKIIRLLFVLTVFALVGSIGAATIDSLGPVPDCHRFPNQPRCNEVVTVMTAYGPAKVGPFLWVRIAL